MASWTARGAVIDTVPRRRVFIERGDKNLVTVLQTGGVGNRIYQIWAGQAFAERTGREFVFVEQKMTHNSHTTPRATKDFLLALFPTVRVFRGRTVWRHIGENEVASSAGGGDVILEGFFQSAYGGMKRGSLKIPRPITDLRFSTIGIDFYHAYFVHFRFGDYVVTEYNVDLTTYYKTALTAVVAADPEATFLLFSDEPSKIPLGLFESYRYTPVPFSIGIWETLWLMSRCCGGITANSTFSAVVAWALPERAVIYMPSLWRQESVAHGPCLEKPAWVTVI